MNNTKMSRSAFWLCAVLQVIGHNDVLGFTVGNNPFGSNHGDLAAVGGGEERHHHPQQRNIRPSLPITFLMNKRRRSSVVRLSESLQSDNSIYVEAEDLLGIQALFNKFCDEDGLMNKSDLERVPVIAEMLVSLCVSPDRSSLALFSRC